MVCRPRTAALAAVLVLVAAAPAAAQTTAARTILDQDGDNRLELRSGDPYLVRPDLGLRSPGGPAGACVDSRSRSSPTRTCSTRSRRCGSSSPIAWDRR